MLNRTGFIVKSLMALSICAAASVAAAQSTGDPNLNPTLQAAPTSAGMQGPSLFGAVADPYGTARGSTWIDATRFTLPLSSTAPSLSYQLFHYYTSAGSATPQGYFAPMDDVPNGALIDTVSCIYNDPSATNNVFFSVQKYSTDFSVAPPLRTSGVLASFTSTGSPGIAFVNMAITPNETHIKLPSGLLAQTYHIRADIASDTSFSGCFVFWKRQISPAPAVATFSDVPTSYLFFQQIEALVASGITSGCAAGQYCPDAPVTRAQMAAFLARALGLHFPN